MGNTIIPQSFIDGVQLQLDNCMQTIKDKGADEFTTEELSLMMYDKRGMIDDTQHRQVLSVMVAILIKRVCNA